MPHGRLFKDAEDERDRRASRIASDQTALDARNQKPIEMLILHDVQIADRNYVV